MEWYCSTSITYMMMYQRYLKLVQHILQAGGCLKFYVKSHGNYLVKEHIAFRYLMGWFLFFHRIGFIFYNSSSENTKTEYLYFYFWDLGFIPYNHRTFWVYVYCSILFGINFIYYKIYDWKGSS